MWPHQDTLWCALEVHPEEFHPACTCRLPCTSSTVAPRHTSWHVRRKVGSPGYLFGFADQGHQKMLFFFSCSLLGCARLENDVDIMWYNWVHPLELAMVMNQLHIRYTSIGILGSGNLKVESVHFCWLSLSGNNQKKITHYKSKRNPSCWWSPSARHLSSPARKLWTKWNPPKCHSGRRARPAPSATERGDVRSHRSPPLRAEATGVELQSECLANTKHKVATGLPPQIQRGRKFVDACRGQITNFPRVAIIYLH